MISPVADRPVQRMVSRSVVWDDRMDEVSVLSWPVCVPLIRMYVVNAALTHEIRACSLYPAGAGDLKGGSVDSQRRDHRRTVIWDPGIADSRVLSVCYDCLCLMTLFWAVMSLVHHWAEWSVWTGTNAWYCRTIASTGKNVIYHVYIHPVFVLMLNRDRNISPRRCACMRGTSVGVLSAGRISLMLSGCFAFGGGLVDCSDWPRVYCAVHFSPGGVWIGYIRQELWDRSLTDAASVTGSLVSSALFDCLDIYCAAGFTSCRTFCSTDCGLLAGFGLSLRQVSEYWTMATNGAALVENRAGITFGVTHIWTCFNGTFDLVQ